MDKPWKGKLFKPLDGRASYEVFEAEVDFLTPIQRIVESFGFEAGPPLVGLDQVFMRFSNDSFSRKVTLMTGWDNWSGCFVRAEDEEGDPFVVEIGKRVDVLLEELGLSAEPDSGAAL